MMIALTGTPGTGKTSIADELQRRGVPVIRATDTVGPYRMGADPERDTEIIDEERWVAEWNVTEGVVEGHMTHLLPADRIVILRCRPDILQQRLVERGYPEDKIRENVEAELLDVILIETVEIHEPEKIYEIDTTSRDVTETTDWIQEVISGTASPTLGTVDWLSECGEMI